MILTAVLVLGIIGALFAVVLFFVAQKFKVIEDPLIDQIAEVLPGANCGGCGKAGCRAMAEAFVKQGNMDGLKCPAGGESVAQKVAELLGCTPEVSEPQVAVVRCNGSCANATAKNHYDGLRDCSFAHSVYAGESGCVFGCLGLGNKVLRIAAIDKAIAAKASQYYFPFWCPIIKVYGNLLLENLVNNTCLFYV